MNCEQRGKKEVKIVLRDNLYGWMDKRIGRTFIANLSMYFMIRNSKYIMENSLKCFEFRGQYLRAMHDLCSRGCVLWYMYFKWVHIFIHLYACDVECECFTLFPSHSGSFAIGWWKHYRQKLL